MLQWFAEMLNRLEEEMNYGQDQLRRELSSLTSVGMMNKNRFIMWLLNLWKNKIKKKVDCFWSKVMVALKIDIHGGQLLPNSTQMVKLCMQ